MRINPAVTAIAVAAAISAALIGVAGPAGAATESHYAVARADWKEGAKSAAAQESGYWIAARHQLAAYGERYAHERADLAVLITTPVTHTTAAQRAAVVRVTRELNGFFYTPGLYGVTVGHPRAIARSDWVKSARVSAATRHGWLGAANDELGAYGKRFAKQRKELVSLVSIPLTSTTAKQRATARKDIRALDLFFHTPRLKG